MRNQPLRIGYMMNIYPVTSATFIRREMQAMETMGAQIERYAIRRWEEPLVDPADYVEQERTTYLLSGKIGQLFRDLTREIVVNPSGFGRALFTSWVLCRRGGGIIRHIAYLMEAVSLKRQAMAIGLAHIHAHYSTNTAAVALLAYRMGGPGYSFTTHGPDELVDPGPSSLDLKLQEARFAVAISHYCKTRLALIGGPKVHNKLHIVRCGLPLKDFALSEIPISEDAPFVCVGRLCHQKAQVLIAKAVAKLVPKHPELRVVFIGDGEVRSEIEAIVDRHGLANNIALLGWQNNLEVKRQLAQARALLLPSLAEGLPVAIMEAMALGRPVISTYIAGIPELVDDKVGWIVPAGSVDYIAEAMRSALTGSPEKLTTMGLAGRERILEKHDVVQNAEELLKLIDHYV